MAQGIQVWPERLQAKGQNCPLECCVELRHNEIPQGRCPIICESAASGATSHWSRSKTTDSSHMPVLPGFPEEASCRRRPHEAYIGPAAALGGVTSVPFRRIISEGRR